MTTPLFLLRCVEIGISIRDLDLLTIGLVLDMWTEKGNDDVKYKKVAREATQEDFDAFLVFHYVHLWWGGAVILPVFFYLWFFLLWVFLHGERSPKGLLY